MKHISTCTQCHGVDINVELSPMSLFLEIFLHYVKMLHMIKKYNVITEKGRKYRKFFSTKIIQDVHYFKCQSKNELEMK